MLQNEYSEVAEQFLILMEVKEKLDGVLAVDSANVGEEIESLIK
jgi:hypothetical protein